MAPTPLQTKILEEIHLLKCSLLPGELLEFIEQATLWSDLLDAYALDPDGASNPATDVPPAHFRVKIEASADVWFEVVYGSGSDAEPGQVQVPQVLVKGDSLGRAEQARWQEKVAEAEAASTDSEYPLYEMISAHILPQLHAYLEERAIAATVIEAGTNGAHAGLGVGGSGSRQTTSSSASTSRSSLRYHVLFVSHHLKSPQKRRSLSQWSHELSLVGLAKVGYPGVIYCEGAQEDVEDFVGRVRSMQWLALRLRFVEPAPAPSSPGAQDGQRGRWAELEKVGEVVEEMRRLGREQFVVEMGIGSAGTVPTDK
ncbi:hypothetical protein GSI_05985 [Ganoderma sinense ZZ0214-1]|uniref:Small nuclear ribonucleoprotein Prp3 C-terminal domain-containing protein n=1 Tax=Ganoderma sinense ZZ0214-1 TaxID=1077348 RepID=A0A2G8SBZ7_9APHY|nr:hypothetical protein GSI_05985 [Ganoderma sinense ZZ0214-1]